MPLLFDMPRERLETYQGTNPRPADFDEYWERGLTEMRALDPEVELVPAEFQTPFAECFDMFFTGVGGARIHAMLVRPKHVPRPHPAVVLFHGYTASAGEWNDKLAYASLGFTIAALDCRGQSGLSEDSGSVKGSTHCGHIIRGIDDEPERMLFRQIFLDCAQLAGLVMDMPEVDETRVGCLGGSQGGGLSLACAALEPRIRRAAPNFPFLCDYQRVWEMDQAQAAYAELKDHFRRYDPLHEREEEIFTQLGYIDVQHLTCRIRAEVLMGVGFCDTVCPPSTQFAAYNKITSPKSYVAYPDFGHEGLPGHSDRVLQFMLGL
ncbi:MAG: prolyl oligopeptidase family serine peptidase [Victivallales bacterium]|jgi:cephalosporin-C deacetylase|nr:prolyl oligopeptidase family serine peptidase [Victivallales bacterium]